MNKFLAVIKTHPDWPTSKVMDIVKERLELIDYSLTWHRLNTEVHIQFKCQDHIIDYLNKWFCEHETPPFHPGTLLFWTVTRDGYND